MDPALPVLSLARSAERRLRDGHLWVYSNELNARVGNLGLEAGALVELRGSSGAPLGVGYFNPATLIAVRLLSRQFGVPIDAGFFNARLARARQLRRQLGRERFGRQVHGEADGLPGLILDRYGEVLVGQLGTAGLELRRELLEAAIRAVFADCTCLLWRSTGAGRVLEGLPEEDLRQAYGPPIESLELEEGPARFQVPLAAAQKTGWFYDQRDNRDRVYGLLDGTLAGQQMLDICSYQGGWALRALHAGASVATCVDASAEALRGCSHNAALNGFDAARLQTLRGSAMDVLRELPAEQRFGLVVVDPPAFIKRRKDAQAGAIAYARLFASAMRRVQQGGWLVACSCSHHYASTDLLAALAAAAAQQGRALRVLAELAQGVDHPVHPAMPETRYLKGLLCALD